MSTTMPIYIYLWSLLNCVLGVLACSCAHVLGVFMCWRSWCACMLGILTYSRVCHVYIFTCLACLFVLFPYVLTCLKCLLHSNVFCIYMLECFFNIICSIFFIFEKFNSKKPSYRIFFYLFREGFGAHLNIYKGTFCKNNLQLKAFQYFCKKAPS